MLVPNRHKAVDDGYRYGFQGQEKDDEIKGEGNSLNYTFRMHDPRVGRFFTVDPLTKKYPWYTPYQFSGNKVIQFIELEGLEEHEQHYDRMTQHILATRNIEYHKGDLRKGGVIMLTAAVIVVDAVFTRGIGMRIVAAAGLGEAISETDRAYEAKAKGNNEEYERRLKNAGEASKAIVFEGIGTLTTSLISKVLSIAKHTKPVFELANTLDDYDQVLQFNLKNGDEYIYLGEASMNNSVLELDFSIPYDLKGKGIGTQMFQNALETFGSEVKKIRGLWTSGDNLAAYNNAIRAGKSTEEAIFSTPSGKWAKANGYDKFEWSGYNNFNPDNTAKSMQVNFIKTTEP